MHGFVMLLVFCLMANIYDTPFKYILTETELLITDTKFFFNQLAWTAILNCIPKFLYDILMVNIEDGSTNTDIFYI